MKILYRLNNWIRETFDAIVYSKGLKQLGCLMGFAIAILFILWLISWNFYGPSWETVYYYLDPGNAKIEPPLDGPEPSFGERLFAVIASFLGMVFLGGLLITTFTNIVNQRVDRINTGTFRYNHITDFYLILGYDETVTNLIKMIHGKHPDNRIVVMTNQNVQLVRQEVLSQLDDKWEKQVLFYFGDIRSEEELSNLGLGEACEIYIVGEKDEDGRDSKNFICARMVSSLMPKREHPIIAHIEFNSYYTIFSLQRIRLTETDDVKFRPYNICENFSRRLWGFDPQEYLAHKRPYDLLNFAPDPEGTKQVHLVIAGFHNMGVALLCEALRVAHYPSFNTHGIKSKITVVDPEMEIRKAEFLAVQPHLDQIRDIDVEFVADAIYSAEMRARLDEWACDTNQMLTIAICETNPDKSLNCGLHLPESVYYQLGRDIETMPRVLIRQCTKSNEMKNFIKDSDLDEKPRVHYHNVKFFGMQDDCINEFLFDDFISTLRNYVYDKEKEFKKLEKEYHWEPTEEQLQVMIPEAEKTWNNLEEVMKWANRYQIDFYSTILDMIGEEITEEELNVLSRVEHRRWEAERTIAGFRQKRDGENRENGKFDHLIHECFMPFDELDPKYKTNDKNVISFIKKAIEAWRIKNHQ